MSALLKKQKGKTMEISITAERLGRLIRYATINDDGVRPWAVNSGPMPEHVRFVRDTWVNRLGLRAQWFPEAEVYAIFVPALDPRPPVIWWSHLDVVPTVPERWTKPRLAFSGALIDHRVWGRGALDMKCVPVMQLDAVEMMLNRSMAPSRNVVICLGNDEEFARPGQGADQMSQPAMLEALGGPTDVLDEGAFGIDFMGCSLAAIAVAEKGWIELELEVDHKAEGHASMPTLNTAPNILTAALWRVRNWQTPRVLMPHHLESLRRIGTLKSRAMEFVLSHANWPGFQQTVLNQMCATPKGNAMVRNTAAITMGEWGIKSNVIPTSAKATLNCRLLPEQEIDEFLAALAAQINDPRVQIRVLRRGVTGPVSRWDTDQFRALERIMLDMMTRAGLKNPLVSPAQTPATTDSRYFAAAGLQVCRLVPFMLPDEQLKTIHSQDEHITLAQLRFGRQAYLRMLTEQ